MLFKLVTFHVRALFNAGNEFFQGFGGRHSSILSGTAQACKVRLSGNVQQRLACPVDIGSLFSDVSFICGDLPRHTSSIHFVPHGGPERFGLAIRPVTAQDAVKKRTRTSHLHLRPHRLFARSSITRQRVLW